MSEVNELLKDKDTENKDEKMKRGPTWKPKKVKFEAADDKELARKDWLEAQMLIPFARASRLSAKMFSRMVSAGSLMPVVI